MPARLIQFDWFIDTEPLEVPVLEQVWVVNKPPGSSSMTGSVDQATQHYRFADFECADLAALCRTVSVVR